MAFGEISVGIKECSKCEYNLRCNECINFELNTATEIINLLEMFNKNGDNTYAIKLVTNRFQIVRKTKEKKAAVEAVRCRDCKHNEDNGGDCNRTITHMSRDYVCEVNKYKYIGLEYCSYGERKEVKNENNTDKSHKAKKH